MSTAQHDITPLRTYVRGMTELVDSTSDEGVLLARGRDLLAELIRDDHWLPPEYATAR